MLRVKLSEGKAVSHPTLGTGIVLSADDEFCTIRFASKEAMFRLPDAFEKGFLSSPEAILTEVPGEEDYEEEEEELIEEEEEEVGDVSDNRSTGSQLIREQQPKISKPTVGDKVLAFICPLFVFVPAEMLLISLYIDDTSDDFLLILVIAFFLMYLFFVWLFAQLRLASGSKNSSNGREQLTIVVDHNTQSRLDQIETQIREQQSELEKQEREKKRYDSLFWAESIRDKNLKDRY